MPHTITVLSPITLEQPLREGERVFFRDPAEDVSTGWYTVVNAPAPEPELADNPTAYNDTVISLINEAGSQLEALPCELYRGGA